MIESRAVINPQKGKAIPDIGSLAIMVATDSDISYFNQQLKDKRSGSLPLMMSHVHLYSLSGEAVDCVFAGPMIGAPYATMLLENLIAWGIKEVVFIGWCGAIDSGTHIGDIILPTGAFIDEGTSKHYFLEDSNYIKFSTSSQQKKIISVLNK